MQVVFVESIERTGRHFQRRWDRAGGTAHDRSPPQPTRTGNSLPDHSPAHKSPGQAGAVHAEDNDVRDGPLAAAAAAAPIARSASLPASAEALGLAIRAATDRPDDEQDGAERNRDEEQQDDYLNKSHLNQLPVSVTAKSRRLHAAAD
jgi:hypothetical protein